MKPFEMKGRAELRSCAPGSSRTSRALGVDGINGVDPEEFSTRPARVTRANGGWRAQCSEPEQTWILPDLGQAVVPPHENKESGVMNLAINLPHADLEVDQTFDAIVGCMTLTVVDERTVPEKNRISVLLDLPHLEKYGHQRTHELVYGCNFAVVVGDQVLCPPTPLYSKWTTGVVTALDGGRFRGRVKHVREVRNDQSEEGEQR